MLKVHWRASYPAHARCRLGSDLQFQITSPCVCASGGVEGPLQFALVTFVRQLTWLSPWESLSGSRHLGRVVISALEPAVPSPISPPPPVPPPLPPVVLPGSQRARSRAVPTGLLPCMVPSPALCPPSTQVRALSCIPRRPPPPSQLQTVLPAAGRSVRPGRPCSGA